MSKIKPKFEWRHQYDDNADIAAGIATAVHNTEPSLTEQHHKDDCDLNVIAERYGLENNAIPVIQHDPRLFGDFSDAPDLKTALDRTIAAREHFMALPAKIRARFHNDPLELLNFVSDDDNAEEAKKLGLMHEGYMTPRELAEKAKDEKAAADLAAAKATPKTVSPGT